ncbi:MAG: nitrogenase component 1 [Atopobiaceae bacterium]|jgi:hypothetical protein|nr:nitrogenase component 1 [Atopobiaceae bacterium]MCH4213647.1 nitrogenase component 1 [Atopobiaceae bacterium]MCI1259746.1 nitrogenase component 1 [Atopobiaceae bacterium]MDD2587487.1 nitrogenase component 1 [Atopobiaceae bacterium]MDD4380216.1 nitrogenase component 1 [Atopobiaceae bacterium]
MRQTQRIEPVYTGDVSGAASALFELGGMVVLHDPSGCNSTYNTFDETRWYDQDSLVFLSGLKESDALMGNDRRLVDDVVAAARDLAPRFVALVASPIPYLVGSDLDALAATIGRECGVPCFALPTNGMHDYVRGAGAAFAEVARRFVDDARPQPRHLNILGATPLDLMADGALGSIRAWVEGAGWQVTSCWAMGDTLDGLGRAAQGSVNLVVSATGMAAAKVLRERFGTPWVAGTPVPGFADGLARALDAAERTGECSAPCGSRRADAPAATAVVVGEPVAMGSVAVALAGRLGRPFRLVCPLEADNALLGAGDVLARGEEEVARELEGADLIVADPLWKLVAPPAARFLSVPHLAFSGRVYRGEAIDLAHLMEGGSL